MPSLAPITLPATVAVGLALLTTLASPAEASPPGSLTAVSDVAETAAIAPAALSAATAKKTTTATKKAGPVPQVVPATLSLGPAHLPERRTEKTLAPGVVLTTITRGDATTDRWVVRTVTIDPKVAEGELRVTYGRSLAGNDRTTDMMKALGALAGINGSYFSPGTSRPGDPRGLTIADGVVLSEPSGYGAEVTLLVDSATNSMKVARLRWSATARNTTTGKSVPVVRVNAAPNRGEVAEITRHYGKVTPRGAGTEVVLDRKGCVVKVADSRGVKLKRGQTSLQAVGSAVKKLRKVAAKGCLAVQHEVLNRGRTVELTTSLSAMTGRVWLLNDGTISASDRDRYLWRRHPRTVAGFTWDGKVVMMTVDGRTPKSGGATMLEAATIARDLGLRDAMNLDGGGSTTLGVNGKVVNTLRTERVVSDALVWLPKK